MISLVVFFTSMNSQKIFQTQFDMLVQSVKLARPSRHCAASNLLAAVFFFCSTPGQKGDRTLLHNILHYSPIVNTLGKSWKHRPESVRVNWFNSCSSCSAEIFKRPWGTAGRELSGSTEGRRPPFGTSGKPERESGFDSSNKDFSSSSNSSMSSSTRNMRQQLVKYSKNSKVAPKIQGAAYQQSHCCSYVWLELKLLLAQLATELVAL